MPHDPALARPLDDLALDELDALLERLPDAKTTEEVDGLFCALVIGPRAVPPSDWLPEVLGENREWADERAMHDLLTLLLRHWNAVAQGFREDWGNVTPEEGADQMFFPLLDSPGEGRPKLGAQWASGFRIGLDFLEEPDWEAMEQDEECMAVLSLIAALGTGEKSPGVAVTDSEREEFVPLIAAGLQYLYAFWRRRSRAATQPHRAPEVPGRNDPCPCGSGQKFKKCCGAPGRLH